MRGGMWDLLGEWEMVLKERRGALEAGVIELTWKSGGNRPDPPIPPFRPWEWADFADRAETGGKEGGREGRKESGGWTRTSNIGSEAMRQLFPSTL